MKSVWIGFAIYCLYSCGATIDSLLIENVLIVDGSGSIPFSGSVRISGDKILQVGHLKRISNEPFIDGQGKVLAPGFIDTHSHHDKSMRQRNPNFPGLFLKRNMPEVVSQGVSTIIIGQDGSSNLPLSDFWENLDSLPVAVNIASYAGHNTIRKKVMQGDYQRMARQDEIEEMKKILKFELLSGAFGLSTGLEYDPGIYSSPDEVLQLAALLSKYQGGYISHMRSEDRDLEKAIEELLNIGKQFDIPVQISHFKLARVSLWQKASRILARLDSARAAGIDVTADIYPYEYWQSTLSVLFPERDFDDIAAAKYALSELTTAEGVIISSFAPDTNYVGKTLADIASLRGQSPERTCLDLIKESQGIGSSCRVMARSMHHEDIATIINWPHANICSDGGLDDRHPRGAGSFPRILRKYVREDESLDLAKAIQKMTSNAAENMGIAQRGYVREGYYADLVLFDPALVEDLATFANPGALSSGILKLWVNGILVWQGQKTTQAFPGAQLKRAL